MTGLRDYADIEMEAAAPDAVLIDAAEVDGDHWIGLFDSPTRGLLLCLARRIDPITGSAGSTEVGDMSAVSAPWRVRSTCVEATDAAGRPLGEPRRLRMPAP